MKLYLSTLFFSLSSILFAQNKPTEILYDIYLQGDFLDSESKKNVALVDMMDGIENHINAIKFTLIANDSISVFSAVPAMSKIESTSYDMAQIMAGTGNTYVRNHKMNALTSFLKFGGTRYQVTDVPKILWKITNKTETINGYECLQATYFDPKRNKEVIAWFCPKIPLPIGPAEYGGLPGLILKLEYGKFRFTATQINFKTMDSKLFTIKSQGKKMTAKEYDEMVDGVVRERNY